MPRPSNPRTPSDRARNARTLSAQDATERLGVTRATLYAYVSRGLIRSEPGDGATRERRYHTADIEKLLRRKQQRKDPAATTRAALNWGEPVLESALTLIQDGRLYYRGHDAARLAEHSTLEQVAGLLWTGESRQVPLPLHARLALQPTHPGGTLMELYGHALTHAAAHDLHATDTRQGALPAAAARVLGLLFAVTEHAAGIPAAPDLPLHERLARAWNGTPAHADLLRRALILTADHELNVSSFTARCVASSGASLHHATLGALSALQGARHGLSAELCHDMLRSATERGPRGALARAARHHGHPPGFGHALYPDGDPRATALLTALHAAFPGHPVTHTTREISDAARTELGAHPNIDLALAALVHTLGGPPGHAIALFALGRATGWLAHAIETTTTGRLIRPRAQYTGPAPKDAKPSGSPDV